MLANIYLYLMDILTQNMATQGEKKRENSRIAEQTAVKKQLRESEAAAATADKATSKEAKRNKQTRGDLSAQGGVRDCNKHGPVEDSDAAVMSSCNLLCRHPHPLLPSHSCWCFSPGKRAIT